MLDMREIIWNLLEHSSQNMELSNGRWDRRAVEFSALKKRDEIIGRFQQFADLTNASILDIGCGTGRYLKELLAISENAEGLEPSSKMVAQAKKYLLNSGFTEDSIQIHVSDFQSFQAEKTYDYLFIANNPMLNFQENYKKLFSLAKKGIFLTSWLLVKESILVTIARHLGKFFEAQRNHALLSWAVLSAIDSYEIDFSVKKYSESIRNYPEEHIHRYASWLYGNDYSEQDMNDIRQVLISLADVDGKVLNQREETDAFLYITMNK